MTKHEEAEQTLKREIIQRTDKLEVTDQTNKEKILKQIRDLEESLALLESN